MPSHLPKPELISQADLRRAFLLKSEISRLQEQLDEIHEGLYLQMKAGAQVELGPHTCEIVVRRKGRTMREMVKVR
jgi:hypothetical protein